MNSLVLNLAALASLAPAAIISVRRAGAGRDLLYWLTLGVAIAGPVALVSAFSAGAWRTGFAATLWVSVAATMILFAGLVGTSRQAWRLTPLLVPYLAVLGVFAAIFQQGASGAALSSQAPPFWVDAHILVAVTAYGLFTMAAMASLAGFLQEKALKTKRPNRLTRMLPAVIESESLTINLLLGAEIVLGIGLATGMAVEFFETGSVLRGDHKVLLSWLAFLVVGGLLVAHRLTGVRGKSAARFVLLAYLLISLGYPGVKFVTGFLAH